MQQGCGNTCVQTAIINTGDATVAHCNNIGFYEVVFKAIFSFEWATAIP